MNSIDILLDLAARPLEAARALHPQLTAELLNAHPHHDNSVAWLLWHAAREIDAQVSHLSGDEPVWTAQAFDSRFEFSAEANDMGYGHSPRRAREIVTADAGLLFAHVEAAVEAQRAYIGGLDPAELDDVIDDSWDPPVTRGARLISISADAVAHLGQASYIVGMDEDAFE